MPQWPASLPASPLLDGFQETPPVTVIRTEMEQGPAKVRQRTTAAVRRLSLSYILSSDQMMVLDDFFTLTLGGGALAFDYIQPRTGNSVSCRFVKPPEYSAANGPYFKAALTLEILP